MTNHTHIIPIKNDGKLKNDLRFPQYNNILIVLIKTGFNFENTSISHYDLALPKNFDTKYDINERNEIIKLSQLQSNKSYTVNNENDSENDDYYLIKTS
jgi:uncharacterized ubiquitin-like protein YukD